MSNIINELYQIITTLREGKNVDFEKVDELLNHYCENPIVEADGFTTHPFTDPLCAETLNQEYHKKTGVDHTNYISHQLGIINGLLQDKEMLLQAKAYKPEYFEQLETIKSRIERDGLLKADKLGNPVPVNIQEETAKVAQRYVASLGNQAKDDRIETTEIEK